MYQRKCKQCDKEFSTETKAKVFCNSDCSKFYHRDIKAKAKYKVFERDGFRCVYCGVSIHEYDRGFVLDHVVPKSFGGDDTLYNLASSCHECNSGKSYFRLQPELEAEILSVIKERTDKVSEFKKGMTIQVFIANGTYDKKYNNNEMKSQDEYYSGFVGMIIETDEILTYMGGQLNHQVYIVRTIGGVITTLKCWYLLDKIGESYKKKIKQAI